MREKNRKPIASYIKLPQFTTMNVIDGQAGVIIYSSLICYSLTIDNILNIIVLLILAGVTIVTLTGDSGLLQKAQTAKEQNEEAKDLELIKLAVSAAKVEGKGIITKENLNNELNKNFNTDKTVIERSNYYIYKTDKSYIIYKDGKVEEGILLPDEYQQVEYIESSGTQYIDTKLIFSDKYQVSVKFQYKTLENDENWITSDWLDSKGLLIGTYKKTFYFYAGNEKNTGIRYSTEADTKVHNVSINKTNVIVDNNIVTFTNFEDLPNLNSNRTIKVFKSNHCNNNNSIVDLFNIKYYDINDKLVRDFIPCKRKSDNKPGLYDLVNNEFYINKGAGKDFTTGFDI